jgi:serine/threonine-protein kinase
MPLARTAARKALSLDPTLAEGHLALAMILWEFDFEWAEADQEFRRAIECNAGYEPASLWCGYFLYAQLRVEDGSERIERALELDPLSPLAKVFHGFLPFYRREYIKTAEAFREAVQSSSDFANAHFWLAWSLVRSGHAEEALPEARLAAKLNPDPLLTVQFAIVLRAAGHADSAQAIRKMLEKRAASEYLEPVALAKLYTALDEKDLAFQWLEKGFERRDIAMVWLKADPDFDSLRSDPRYAALLRQMNLPLTP